MNVAVIQPDLKPLPEDRNHKTNMLKIKIIQGFFVLHVDGVGEYAMKNEDGQRCMLLFSTQAAVVNFVERMEMPTYKSWTALEISPDNVVPFLDELQKSTPLIAFDPNFNDELSPFRISDILRDSDKL